MNLDDAFWPALWSLAASVGTRPEVLLAVWFAESGLDPRAQNAFGCIGLNQSCPKAIGGPGFPNDDAAAYAQAPASAQLAWIGAQVKSAVHTNGGPFRSAARYYQANYLPATLPVAKRPTDVIAGAAGPLASAYAANKGLDVTGDGVITLDDLALWLERRIQSGGGAFEAAVARAYAERPAGAPWTAPDLVLFEPPDLTPVASDGRHVAGPTMAAALARPSAAPLLAAALAALAVVGWARGRRA